jgi:hypothetical protein
MVPRNVPLIDSHFAPPDAATLKKYSEAQNLAGQIWAEMIGSFGHYTP